MTTALTFINDYHVLAIIGDGGQANVQLCSNNFKLYAVKVFNTGVHKAEAFNREASSLSLLNHQNLVKMFVSIPDATLKYRDGTQIKKSIIVLQYAEKGDLFEYISHTKGFKPEFCRHIFNKILNGLEYLNEIGISHRDIKPQNILFDSNFHIKISDLGLSTLSEGAQKDFVLKTRVGTQGFKAPQVDQGSYNGLKADIFAAGVILFVIFVGTPPFLSTKSSDKIYKYIINKNFEKFWSIHEKSKPKGFFPQSFKKLINSLICSNPEGRPSIQNIRESQWLNQKTASLQELKEELSRRFQTVIKESEVKKNILSIIQKNKHLLVKEQNVLKMLQNCEQTCIQQNPETKELQKILTHEDQK